MSFRRGGLAMVKSEDEIRNEKLSSSFNQRIHGWRPLTQQEYADWEASPSSKGMDDAGETKLPPQNVYVSLKFGSVLIVVQARCRAPRGAWDIPNCMEVFDPVLGVKFFVQKKFMKELVDAS